MAGLLSGGLIHVDPKPDCADAVRLRLELASIKARGIRARQIGGGNGDVLGSARGIHAARLSGIDQQGRQLALMNRSDLHADLGLRGILEHVGKTPECARGRSRSGADRRQYDEQTCFFHATIIQDSRRNRYQGLEDSLRFLMKGFVKKTLKTNGRRYSLVSVSIGSNNGEN